MPRVSEQAIDTFGRILLGIVLCGLVLVSDGCATYDRERIPVCWEE